VEFIENFTQTAMHVAGTSATLNGRRHGLNAAGALVWQHYHLHVPTL